MTAKQNANQSKTLKQQRRELEEKRAEIERELATVRKQEDEQSRKSTIICAACGKRSVISTVKYYTTDYYSPYGGNGGWDVGGWVDGDDEFDCPKCGIVNVLRSGGPYLRDNDKDWPQTHPYVRKKRFFKSVGKREVQRVLTQKGTVRSYADKKGVVRTHEFWYGEK